MTTAAVRIAGEADVDALVELRRSWTSEHAVGGELDDPTFTARFRAWFDRERLQRTFWLADLTDSPAIGMVNLLRFDRMPTPGRDRDGWGYLGNLYVRPEHRGRGVGRQLLDALVAHAEASGLARIVLHPTERSVAFYRRAGFGPADQLLLRPGSGTSAPAPVVQGA